MVKLTMMVLGSIGLLVGCTGCDAVSIVAESLSLAGGIVGMFG